MLIRLPDVTWQLRGRVDPVQRVLAHSIPSASRFWLWAACALAGLTTWRLLRQTQLLAAEVRKRNQLHEKERQLVDELQAALVNVKTLKGLLPICANCKSIRDDNGYWKSIEEYMCRHSEAEFTHGICPACYQDSYGALPPVAPDPASRPDAK